MAFNESNAPKAIWFRYKKRSDSETFSYECGNCHEDALVKATSYCTNCGYDMRRSSGEVYIVDKETGHDAPQESVEKVDKYHLPILANLYYVGECYGKPRTCVCNIIDIVGDSYLTRNGLVLAEDIDTGLKRPYCYTTREAADIKTAELRENLCHVEVGDEFFVIGLERLDDEYDSEDATSRWRSAYKKAKVNMYHPEYESGDIQLVEVVENGCDRPPMTFHSDIGKVTREDKIFRDEEKAKAFVAKQNSKQKV